MSLKQFITHLLRKAGLLGTAEYFRSIYFRLKTYRLRSRFAKAFPEFTLPPWAIAYDAYASFDPYAYRETGKKHAQLIQSLILKHAEPSAKSICDWGCGPLRVLRQLPDLMGPEKKYIGMDYNHETMTWAKANFPHIEFRENALTPPLPLADNEVDVLYCISVFTHLSEKVFNEYVHDIYRALKPGGVLIMSLHGDRCTANLLPEEMEKYSKGRYVERGGVKEGKRAFVAYHNPKFVINAFQAYNLLEHITSSEVSTFQQDWWAFKKPVA